MCTHAMLIETCSQMFNSSGMMPAQHVRRVVCLSPSCWVSRWTQCTQINQTLSVFEYACGCSLHAQGRWNKGCWASREIGLLGDSHWCEALPWAPGDRVLGCCVCGQPVTHWSGPLRHGTSLPSGFNRTEHVTLDRTLSRAPCQLGASPVHHEAHCV
jgi:hypothetical protein